MARRPRIAIPRRVHHVIQQGNHQHTLFFSDRDRIVYLQFVEKYSSTSEITLVGYTFKDNHVHLIVIPEQELKKQLLPKKRGRKPRSWQRRLNRGNPSLTPIVFPIHRSRIDRRGFSPRRESASRRGPFDF